MHIHHQQGQSHSWQRFGILTLSTNQSQRCILLWICLIEQKAQSQRDTERKNKLNTLQPHTLCTQMTPLSRQGT